MNNDYTYIGDAQPQMYPQQQAPPPRRGDQLELYRRYLSDAEMDSDDEMDDDTGAGDYGHYYGVLTIGLLLVILYYVLQIHKELSGMYEEA